ncbi:MULTISPECIES: dihydrodipicolinate synthase family protein [unclassified Mesorhizobium]|uniref:dihydrodipicolinate synthase family protein n=1 Tax=unclassified Mesorhizobium TaxID=325217 RepID=UPI000BAE9936|nr:MULTISPECIES: dihydrodipicolinate synthase family protein [unclassified Mesorhizobium]TGT56580.1 dihydrodipicolinate synthase family protein [Mesorhizobium sp. M00.F.Ca.ET.170.01.1.1]AZO11640.1 dihydrodipicolinate synthase family protein [Mesorhizobium sp. M3A.F.Ca.ET.080.04.2.1]PBB86741.1 dihydrodipicolinate synthase family protein [Mesorhizobium sp. WSM3876]RWB72725.1 MAG: dihydrodipicolinate synthase family protein [Mesorhizobium sp.]RWE24126.1 MAG: dihydrodipicolinate synthase family pr
MVITLPSENGSRASYRLVGQPAEPRIGAQFSRIAYAAAHVVADPFAMTDPWSRPVIDWDKTMAFRHHLWRLGFRIAEAMDTSQRGMGFDWTSAKELIRRSIAEARTAKGADLASGAGTDHLAPAAAKTLADVIHAYEEQFAFIEGEGGKAIMMASRALAAAARGPGDYAHVYDRLLSQASGKVILHWLGDMFDPALKGYWGSQDFEPALDTVVAIIDRHAHKIEGIKISLLDADKELALRDRLPEGVIMFTGDDFNYPELIAGDGKRHSHALLGIFDAIAPVASAALAKLAENDRAGYDALMGPTVPLSRKIFEAPTEYYKAGIVFMAWLNGHQDHFAMVGGMQSARGIGHYADVFRLADQAGLLADPDLAVARMKALCAVAGV